MRSRQPNCGSTLQARLGVQRGGVQRLTLGWLAMAPCRGGLLGQDGGDILPLVELGQDIHRGAGCSAASSSAGSGLAGHDSQAGGLQVGGLLEQDGGGFLAALVGARAVELGRDS